VSDCSFFKNYIQLFLQENHRHSRFNPYQVLLDNGQVKPVSLCPDFKKKPIKRCINNSIEALLDGEVSGYVEGFMLWIMPIPHAWNQNYDGSWIDYTVPDNKENPTYYGMVIPKEILFSVVNLPEWPMCTGVIQTLAMTKNKEVKEEAFQVFQKYRYI